uniref:Uncharacterized protein n=1 Tax=Mastacembelus armatus TaxID=205130 RepID=A0A3Q3N5B4_9TELE
TLPQGMGGSPTKRVLKYYNTERTTAHEVPQHEEPQHMNTTAHEVPQHEEPQHMKYHSTKNQNSNLSKQQFANEVFLIFTAPRYRKICIF